MTVHEPDGPDELRSVQFAASTDRARRSDHSPINWLLLVPLAATLFPPLYNSIDPTLGSIPFFYWYQLAAIGLSVVVTLIVYTRTRG